VDGVLHIISVTAQNSCTIIIQIYASWLLFLNKLLSSEYLNTLCTCNCRTQPM